MGSQQQYLNRSQIKFAPNNNIDPGSTGPFSLMLANQFKRITRVKLRIFILKVAKMRTLFNLFMNVMQ